MEAITIPYNGKFYDVEIVRVVGAKFEMKISDSKTGMEMSSKDDRPLFVRCAQVLRDNRPEYVALARKVLKPDSYESKLNKGIEALLNGED